ncbi:MAG: hypothetical protein JNM91_14715, partial [Flavobacteriales bacterium]|nr:hypothetical protein [Flavobacteriales bacterium]
DDAGVSCAQGTSSIYTFNALPGFTYYIVVESYTAACTSPSSFNFSLSLTCGPLCTPLVANDACIDAQELTMGTNCIPQGGNLSCATPTAGNNPSCIGGFNSYPDAYYHFQATAPDVFVTLVGGANLRFALYNDTLCNITDANHFACVGPVTSGAPNLVTGLVTGNWYTLRVLQLAASAGVFSVCLQKLDVSDDPCTAVPIDCGDLRFGRTIGLLNNMPSGACPYNGAASTGGVNYFIYTAATDGDVRFSTCGQTGFDTRISVFSMTPDCSNLTCNVMNDNAAGCPGGSSEVEVRAVSGQSYMVLVHGAGALEGTYQMSVICPGTYCSIDEANDRCANSETR